MENEIEKMDEKNSSDEKNLLDELLRIQQEKELILKKENETKQRAVEEAQKLISSLDDEIKQLNEKLSDLTEKKQRILSLLGMGQEKDIQKSRNTSHRYKYNGVEYTSASGVIHSLPQSNEAMREYISLSWADVIADAKNNRIRQRFTKYPLFIENLKKIEIL
ncbi:MAG: hypothetical protein QXH07_05845 [Thermoplasmata archaeon]